ncbi:MAG: four helix bundle protein [Ignavibacteria bacterium]|jgi:four helix bundle protein|nr:four helix bundle protein [Ignavibacteria bacterium]MCU7503736.1 four helix bundle protein [Ignavibacteria bacterium]MCU7517618.1 four helix bundle protein [Ignavibacteria bacterium]
MEYQGFRDLIVYQKAYTASLEIFKITAKFPPEEKFSLVDQIRRSSRSVAANIAEAWSKRAYPKLFVSKLIEVSGEASETTVWLDMSKDLHYIPSVLYDSLIGQYDEISKMLTSMIHHPEKFCH